jgi:hypothetical protein
MQKIIKTQLFHIYRSTKIKKLTKLLVTILLVTILLVNFETKNGNTFYFWKDCFCRIFY